MSRVESYSSLATLASCPFKYRLAYVERLERPHTSAPLVSGTAMHAAFEQLYLRGFNPGALPVALGALRDAWGDYRPPLGSKKEHLTREFAELRLRLYVEERERSPTILEEGTPIEGWEPERMQEFEWWTREHGLVRVRGVPDFPFMHGGRVYVTDHKFPTSGWLNDYYFLRFSLGFQVRIYMAMWEQLSGTPVTHGIINAVSMAPTACDPEEKWAKRKSSPSMVKRIDFMPDQVEDAHEWIAANLMVRDECARQDLWPKNELACDDYGGCDFIPICTAPSKAMADARKMTHYRRKEERA